MQWRLIPPADEAGVFALFVLPGAGQQIDEILGWHGVGGPGTCDRSRFNGDIDALARLWGHAQAAAAPEAQVGPPLDLASFMKSSGSQAG